MLDVSRLRFVPEMREKRISFRSSFRRNGIRYKRTAYFNSSGYGEVFKNCVFPILIYNILSLKFSL